MGADKGKKRDSTCCKIRYVTSKLNLSPMNNATEHCERSFRITDGTASIFNRGTCYFVEND